MSALTEILPMIPMIVAQQCGRQRLQRVPEPVGVMSAASSVAQYDEIMNAKLVLVYAAGLWLIHRIRAEVGDVAVDLACGPGYFTLCLARHLGLRSVTGLDLSAGMVELSTTNAVKQGLEGRAEFHCADVTDLALLPDAHVDLTTFTNAAHHMPDLPTAALVLREMDRVTRAGGLILVSDLVRLRTRALTETFVSRFGADYRERLPVLFEDFRHSMYAAWTAAEFRTLVPADSARVWCHLVPRGLPACQFLVGLPVGQTRLFRRGGFPWSDAASPVPVAMGTEWRLLRTLIALSQKHLLRPRVAPLV